MNFRTAPLTVFRSIALALTLLAVTVRADTAPVPPPPIVPGAPAATTPAQTNLLEFLKWDAIQKEQSPVEGQLTADFVFLVTNTGSMPVTIQRVQTSCGCTVAKLPSEPWVIAPHTNGHIAVSVNLAGKFGIFTKVITVYSPNDTFKTLLSVKINLPSHRMTDSGMVDRSRNQQIAMGDQQAVFKGDCAKCHVEPTRGKMGKPLYVAACGICHEANPRATMVPDLHNLNHPTFYGYWKMIITDGKSKSLMPAFGEAHGGPLTEEQIDSLAKVLTIAFSPAGPAGVPGRVDTNGLIGPARSGLIPPPSKPL